MPNLKPPGVKNPGGWGQTVGGMDIFWDHSLSVLNVLLHRHIIQKGNQRELVHLIPVLLINCHYLCHIKCSITLFHVEASSSKIGLV